MSLWKNCHDKIPVTNSKKMQADLQGIMLRYQLYCSSEQESDVGSVIRETRAPKVALGWRESANVFESDVCRTQT